jgi:PAS domain S-box-containing protein
MVTDISERMRHERAVRASEERYRNIIETTSEGVWMIDGDHRTTYVNRRMAQMLGYGVEEMLGRPLSDFVPQGDRVPLGPSDWHGTGSGREVRYRRKDGSEMWGLLSGSPLTDGTGGYGGALAMIADITDRKRSEESIARLAAIVESSPDAIFSTDLESRITSWNAAAKRIYGYSEAEVLGQSGWLLVVPDRVEEAREVGRTMVEGGSIIDFLSKARTKDGRTIDVAPSVSAIRSASGEVVGTLTIVREVTPPG